MTFLQRLLKPGRFVAAVLFALFLGPAPAAAQDASVPCPAEPTDMTFSYGQMVRCRLDVAGDSDLFRFSGSAGDVIVLLTVRTETTIVPCIEVWRTQAYAYVPGTVNVNEKVCPGARSPESQTLSLLVVEWATDPVLVQVTVSPMPTPRDAG